MHADISTIDVSITDDAASRLRMLLVDEDEDTVVRIREPQSFTAYCRWDILVLSIDEREDDDAEGEARAIPFAIDRELVDRYGEAFFVCLDENDTLVVVAGDNADALSER